MEIEERRGAILKHYGVIRRSGRYPWGSGGDPYQGSKDFQARLTDMRSQGLTDPEIAESLGIKTPELRDAIGIARETVRAANQSMAVQLKDKGYSNRGIAERMLGNPNKESTVRGWLETADDIKDTAILTIANLLRGHQEGKKFLDVGKGTEHHLGVSDVRLRAAVSVLRNEGFELWPFKITQLGTGKPTELKILSPKGSTWADAKAAVDAGMVFNIQDRSEDGGLNFWKPKPDPVSVKSRNIQIRYGDEGGAEMDGIIELRRGVPELDLGASRYAQVRVAVDGTHYLKGMAMYATDLPTGINIRYNIPTPKKDVPNKLAAMKPLKVNPVDAGNRFGAITNPMSYTDSKGNVKQSALNIVNEEGKWELWSKNLSSQFLSKQSLTLASNQLAKARENSQEDLNEIMALTNPIVKKQLLYDFALSADSAAVHLKAAQIPRQATHTILPVNSVLPTEIYAPKFNQGERVALVRYPHGGPFEIPQLTVNNNNRKAKQILGDAVDAVGIHHSVAAQLSGADFDGDTVIVIPNNNNRIKSQLPLQELENFDPKRQYPEAKGMTYMTKANTQKEMGKISNLITDMTIKRADPSEIARAVKHSMVVIDAEKKLLNYKQSEKDNGIALLKTKYQTRPDKSGTGASTLISRANAEARIPRQRPRRVFEDGVRTPGPIDPDTGELVFVPNPGTYTVPRVNARTGEKITVTKQAETKGVQGEFTKDARTLSSGEPMEELYALHANAMKAMANTARKEAVAIQDPKQSPAAKAIYAPEVASLKTKLQNALMNAPLERRAQIVGNATAKARIEARPDIDKDTAKKIRYQSLIDARLQTGASKQRIGGSEEVPFTDREWEAVQSGAVSSSMLREILNNSDATRIRELATPKSSSSLTSGQIALARSMANSGRSITEIAAALGIPRTTLSDNLKK